MGELYRHFERQPGTFSASFRPRQEFFPTGLYGDISIMKSGLALVYSQNLDGRKVSLRSQLVSQNWILGVGNEDGARAVTPCEVLNVPRPFFMEFIEKDPEIGLEVLGQLSTQLRSNIVTISERRSYPGLRTDLVILRLNDLFGSTLIDITKEDIRLLAGCSRERVSTEVARLKKMGVLQSKYRKPLGVANTQLLRQIVADAELSEGA